MDSGVSLPPVEMHAQAQIFSFEQRLSPTVAKIVSLHPEFVLGSYHLFDYDPIKQVVVLSASFKSLLQLCVTLGVLNSSVFDAKSLEELNAILQKPQGSQGGFLRKPGTERWDLKDAPRMEANRPYFDELLSELGFMSESLITTPIKVNHCVIFGATVARLEARILTTFKNLKEGLVTANGHVFLLGSNRKLTDDEKTLLQEKIDVLPNEERAYWSETFQNSELATEANAFSFLWGFLIPKEWQERLNLLSINSTRIGYSYTGTEGHRATTETTVQDWMKFYEEDKPQAIFAVAEHPYGRLCDQFRGTVLSGDGKASLEQFIARLDNATFHFVQSKPAVPPLLSVELDEIARNVYRTKGCIDVAPT